jgi:tRNA U38,U39,U40 pseudouridine synthase TruA
MAAGRTDKGVSALSQVISFFINKDDLPENENNILETMRNHPAVQDGRLAFFDCQTVPKKFHALFSATWRRYMYLYPLNDPQTARDFDELTKRETIEQKGGNENDDYGNDEDENEEKGEKFVDQCPLEDVIYYPPGNVREGVFTLPEEDLNHNTVIDVDIPYLNEMLTRYNHPQSTSHNL